jgi:hypothetical protein
MGVNLIPVEMPKFPYWLMVTMLSAESAAPFDALTRYGRDKLLAPPKGYDWPNSFRCARFIPPVEYIQASRARPLARVAVAKVLELTSIRHAAKRIPRHRRSWVCQRKPHRGYAFRRSRYTR